MPIQELYPFILEKHGIITEKWRSKDPQSKTVQLMDGPWNSDEPDEINSDGEIVKKRKVGDKLAEEGVELGAARTREGIIEESSQASWVMIAAWVKLGINPQVIFNLIDNATTPLVLPNDNTKLTEQVGGMVARINGPGAAGDKVGVRLHSSRAIRAMGVLWERNNISPVEVGEKI